MRIIQEQQTRATTSKALQGTEESRCRRPDTNSATSNQAKLCNATEESKLRKSNTGNGTPTQAKGPEWIYKGMKVNNAIPGKVATTVTFTIQNGKVAGVRVSE